MSLTTKLIRQCGRGGTNACDIVRRAIGIGKVKLEIHASGHTVFNANIKEEDDNPNKMPFEGVLLLVDTASTKPPHGAQQHRIYVPKAVAEKKLEGLIGMAVNYDPGGLEAHATRHKVGIITQGWIDGNKVRVKGIIWKKDFPEAAKDLKKPNLGMSMELADVYVRDENEAVWHLEDFEFTGATILKKDAAAYYNTSLAAQAADIAAAASGGGEMAKDKNKKTAAAKQDTGPQNNGDMSLLASAIGGQISTALTSALTPIVSEFKATTQRLSDEMADMRGHRLIEAAADDVDDDDDDEIVVTAAGADDESDAMAAARRDDDDDESDDMAAAKGDDDESDDDDAMSAARGDDADDDDSSSDDDDDDSLDAMEDLETKPADQEPGEVNKNAANRGSKRTVTRPPRQGETFPGNVAKGRLPMKAAGRGKGKMKSFKKPFPGVSATSIEAAAEHINTLSRQNRKLVRTIQAMDAENKHNNRRMKNQIRTMHAQLERYAELEGRRSVLPVELVNLAGKAGVNLPELKASGEKLTVAQADHMFMIAKNAGINLDPRTRIAMKMQMEQEGLLDAGVVDRGYGRTN